MNTYKISFEQIRLATSVGEILDALERGFSKFGVDYYLVGALAKDTWIGPIHNIKFNRTTGDIDFALHVNTKGVYEGLKEYLIEKEGFIPSKENAFVLKWKDNTEVDLIPFGDVEDENNRVKIEGTGFTTLDVPGFREIFEQGLPEVEIENKYRFRFCTLEGIMVLKLLAWNDRPDRTDDILDISHILRHYSHMAQEDIWENHSDLYADGLLENSEVAAIVLGRKMKEIAVRNPDLLGKIEQILATQTKNPENSKMGIIMIQYFKNTATENVQLLRALLKGFKE